MSSEGVIEPLKKLKHNIAKHVTEKDFQSLKHFAYYRLPPNLVEECENRTGSLSKSLQLFEKLSNADIISEDKLGWLRVVFCEIDNSHVLDLIHEYEMKLNVSPYRVMLYRIAKEIGDKELEELKMLSPKIDKSTLDDVKTPLDLFATLERKGVINERNVDFLKEALNQIDYKKLAKQITDYKDQYLSMDTRCDTEPYRGSNHPEIQRHASGNNSEPIGQTSLKTSATNHHSASLQTANVFARNTATSLASSRQEMVVKSLDIGPRAASVNDSQFEIRIKDSTHGEHGNDGSNMLPKFDSLISDSSAIQNSNLPSDGHRPVAAVVPVLGHAEPSLVLNAYDLDQTDPKRYCEGFDSTKPKQIRMDESVEKNPADDSIADQKASNKEKMLQQAIKLKSQQQLELISSVRAEDDRSLFSLNGSTTGGQEKIQKDGKGAEAKSADVKQYLSQLHTDSPSLCLRPEHSGYRSQTDKLSRHQTGKLLLHEGRSVKSDHPEAIHKESCQPFKLSGYQKELAAPALAGYNNCIMCAPTGSGKMLAAAYICCQRLQEALDKGRQFKALFTVYADTHISQVRERIKEMLPGVNETHTLNDILKRHDIIVLTAEMLVNALKKNLVDLSEIQLLILDECHRTDGSHPYSVVMREYYRLKLVNHSVPQVIGLTATLGIENMNDLKERYTNICANYDCRGITYVRDNRSELLLNNRHPNRCQIISVLSRDCNDLFNLIITFMMNETEKLTPDLTVTKKRGSLEYEKEIQTQTNAEKQQTKDYMFCRHMLLEYNTALMYCDELQVVDVMAFLKQQFNEANRDPNPTTVQKKIYEFYDSHLNEIETYAKKETLAENEKLMNLHNLLANLFSDNPESKGVLLTKTSFCAEGLISFITRSDLLKDFVKCSMFNDSVLAQFKADSTEENHTNLLFMTEECSIMPPCNFVVYYNIVPKKIWPVLSLLVKKSKVYLIVNKGLVDEDREFRDLEVEHALMGCLNKVAKDDLEQVIVTLKRQLWPESEEQLTSFSAFDITDITIHCKRCKQLLCCATDLQQHRPLVIISSTEFDRKISVQKSYECNKLVAYAFCNGPSCNCQLGTRFVCNSEASYGYSLSKDAVVWKKSGLNQYRDIKQWLKVPFSIKEEPVNK